MLISNNNICHIAFGSNGDKVFTNPDMQYNDDNNPSNAILVQPDGKIVVDSTYSGNFM